MFEQWIEITFQTLKPSESKWKVAFNFTFERFCCLFSKCNKASHCIHSMHFVLCCVLTMENDTSLFLKLKNVVKEFSEDYTSFHNLLVNCKRSSLLIFCHTIGYQNSYYFYHEFSAKNRKCFNMIIKKMLYTWMPRCHI